MGLGYLSLNRESSSLSGGELQRVKLASELEGSGNVYVLDEPTTGLHMSDVDRLIGILNRLADRGNTVIVIEHNMELVCQADWIVDLGPGAGAGGGRLMFEGVPRDIVDCSGSITGQYLKEAVNRKTGG
ncbi:hypothetical protein ACFFK0_22895 [Paenibacillus chartarius]|uniref:UvrABC system protein A n=1 Tax=Paenibacillus chartarius TaxID=747481 RepID=A0ABV6DRH7_9BACL